MNHVYRLVWSAARGAYVIAAETARGRGKSGATIRAGALAAMLGACLQAQAQQPPAAPNVVPASSATDAYVAPNGVTVVNIGAANAAGVSHNKFHRYDIDARGLVLNNNANRNLAAMDSQLAGQVFTNTRLGSEAGVILNEVVSPNRSVLAGFTEVLGKKADVIVANPYGITCAGCGFINTDRATLTTGTPVWKGDGRIAGFNVAGGDVLINGGGLNASSQALLDIVTRTLRVDGQINGNDVVLATGANAWNYDTRQLTGAIGPAGERKEYAIDISALGGMYANRIHMIATEAGVGVRMLGEAAARADDFRLDAAGQVVLGGALSAGRDLVVRAARLDAGGNADTVRYAKRNLDLATDGAARLDGGAWVAGGALDLRAGALDAAGGVQLHAGADAVAADRGMRIRSDGALALDAVRLAGKADLLLAAGGAARIASGASVEAGGDIALAAGDSLSNEGTVIAGRGLTANVTGTPGAQASPAFINRGLMQATGASLGIGQAGQALMLDNRGRLLGGSVALYGARLDNQGWIQSDTALNAQAADIVNGSQAAMLGKGAGYRVALDGASLRNDGLIQSAGALDIALAGAASNAGRLLTTAIAEGGADGKLSIAARRVDNSGVIAAAGAARIDAAQAMGNDGRIDGRGLALATSMLSNRGTLHSSTDLTVEPGWRTLVENAAGGNIVADGNLSIDGGGLANSGLLQAGASLEARLAGGLLNSLDGRMLANRGNLLLRANFLDNSGIIQAARSLDASVAATLDNKGRLQTTDASGDLRLEGASVNNGGTIEAANTALIRSSGTDRSSIISNSGSMQSQGDLVLDSAVAIDNTGANSRILSAGALLVEGERGRIDVNNYGRMQAAGVLAVGDSQGRAGRVDNRVSGVMLGQQFTVAADRLENAGAIAADNAHIAAASLLNKGQAAGIVAGAGGANLAIDGALENQGALHSNGQMSIRAGGIVNRNTGGISALGPLAMSSANAGIANAGALYSGGMLTLNAAEQTVDNSGAMGATDIAIAAANVTNTNSIVAANNARIDASREFHNLPLGGKPPMVERESSTFAQVSSSDGGSIFDPTVITVNRYTDTVFSSLADGAKVVPGQILAGNALDIAYGGSAENIASVLSAKTLTVVAGKNAQAFANSGIQGTQTDTASLIKWIAHKNTGKVEYYYPTSRAEVLAGPNSYSGITTDLNVARSQARVFGTTTQLPQGPDYAAAIRANTIVFEGGMLKNSGDPLAARPDRRSADGAAAESIVRLPGQAGVVLPPADGAAAGGMPSAGLDLSLPGNPNGYFIVTRDPAARYLVETNPLFRMSGGVDSRIGHGGDASIGPISGSDYLAMELGFDPERMQKRLGDAGYEQRLIQQQLLAQTGRHLLAGARDETSQMQALFSNAAGQAKALGLRFGAALSEEQIGALERDLVWMVEQEVRGEKVLAPVVYLSRASRQGVQRGTVIAADDITMRVASLDNRGGDIVARNALTVRSRDDVRNVSGVIRGGSVDLQSAAGDIVNATQARTTGDRYQTRTAIGRSASIESGGDMRLDAARDIVVTGAKVQAGGNASLQAGGAVEIDAVADRRADASSTASGMFDGLDRQGRSSSIATTTQRGSSIRADGALDVSSGGDMRIAGAAVQAGGDLLLKSGGDLAITGRSDSTEIRNTVTTSGAGIGGGVTGTQTVVVEKSQGRNRESTVASGGKAVVAADKDVSIQGSSIAADGKLIVAGDTVTVTAARDTDRVSTTVATVSLLKADGSGKATASASAEGQASVIDQSRAEALQKVNGEMAQAANGGAGTKNEASVSAMRMVDATRTMDEQGKVRIEGQDKQTDKAVATSEKTSQGAQPVSVRRPQGKANVGKTAGEASRSASAEASASGKASAAASASGKAGVKLVESTVETDVQSSERLARASLSGQDVNLIAKEDAALEAATVRAARDLKLQGKSVRIESGQEKSASTSTRSVMAAGLLVDSTNTASADASGTVKADAKVSHLARPQGHDGDANASVSADASAKAAARSDNMVDLFRGTENADATVAVRQVGSDLAASRRLAVTAGEDLSVQGSALKGRAAVDLDAARMEFGAAEDSVARTRTSSLIGAGVALKAEGNAQASAKANVSVDASGKLADRGLLNRDSAQAGVAGAAAASASASADARGDAGLQARYSRASESTRSTTARVSSIVSEQGDVNRSAAGEIRDVGTGIEAAGDVSQRAGSINSLAARNTVGEQAGGEDHQGRLVAYGKAGAGVTATASATGGAGVGYLGGNTLNGKAESDTVEGTRAGAGAGAELQYQFAGKDKQGAGGTAVVSSIKAGGKVVSASTAATVFEGTQVSAGKSVDLTAQRMELKAATDTRSDRDQSTAASGKLSGGVGVGTNSPLEGSLAGKLERTESLGDSAKARTVAIAAGQGLSVRTGEDLTLEGASLKAGGDAELKAGGKLSYNAATDVKSSDRAKTTAELGLDAGSGDSKSMASAKLKGGDDRSGSVERKAVAGKVEAGGDIRVEGGRAVTLEGARLDAKGDVDIATEGKLTVAAARDIVDSNKRKLAGGLDLGRERSADPDNKSSERSTSAGIQASAEFETTRTETARTAALNAGGALRTRSGGDSEFEGAALKAGGRVDVAAGGKMALNAAQDRYTSTSADGSLKLGGGAGSQTAPDKKTREEATNQSKAIKAGLEASGNTVDKTVSQAGSITAGAAGAALRAGGDASLEGTAVKSGGDLEIAAGGDLTIDTARSASRSAGASMGINASNKSNTVKTDKNASAQALDLAAHSSVKETHGGARLDADGAVTLAAGGKASLVNAEVKGGAGAGIKAATVEKRTVSNTDATVNVGASVSRKSSGAKKKKADPAKAAQPFEKASPARSGQPSAIRIGERAAKPDPASAAAAPGDKAAGQGAGRPRADARAVARQASGLPGK